MNVRPARPDDLDQIVAIYNHYVVTSHVTFDVEPFSVATRAPWFSQFDGRRRQCWLAEENGRVLGYASSGALKDKAAYQTSVEVSVYLEPRSQGRGIGRALYAALLTAIDRTGVHRCYALVALPNEASLALHAHFGFREVAHLHEVGRKFDVWRDVIWLERCAPAPEASTGR